MTDVAGLSNYNALMTDKAALRVAVLLDSASLRNWQFDMLQKINDSDSAELVLAIIRGEPDPPPPTRENSHQSLSGRAASSLYYRYMAWEQQKFATLTDPFKSVPLEDLQADLPMLTVNPQCTLWSDKASDEDLCRIQQYKPDIMIRLGWRIVRGGLLTVARYGVWSYHHGDNRINRGGPPCVWELINDEASTGLTLQILNEDLDNGLVLARSSVATDPVSPRRTQEKLYWRSVEILPREIELLHHLGAERYFADKEQREDAPAFYSKPLYTEKGLSLRQSAAVVTKCLKGYVTEGWQQKVNRESWSLYYRMAPELQTSLWRFKQLKAPADRYWADPHIIARDDNFFVFVEEYVYDVRKGRIVVIPIHIDDVPGEAVPVLDLPYHLSYPFVFEHEGECYMVPESAKNKTIELYRCTRFPDQWELVQTLMDNVSAVDTTLHHDGERWWMFTNLVENRGQRAGDELYLFSSTDLLSKNWLPHHQRVVKSDVVGARCAGAIQQIDGKLFRPGQNGAGGYGRSLKLYEIERLDQEGYREREVAEILPDWTPEVTGIHTLSHVPGLTVVDAKTLVSRKSTQRQNLVTQ